MAYTEDEKRAVEDSMAKRVIRESISPWASPIVLVKQKFGGVRPCVDYRKVNGLVKPDGFPLPRMKSKKISNDQELIQSDPTSCLQNQKGNN